jgi:C1A family cysteine protease
MDAMLNRKYGYRKDHPNVHKLMYSAIVNPDMNIVLPPSIDISESMPPVYDQGQIGSCVLNAAASLVQFLKPDTMPSRLFAYYNARVLDGDVGGDNGTTPSSAIYVLKNQGVCSEITWPYEQDDLLIKPIHQAYDEALKEIVLQDLALSNLNEMRHCLAHKFPFMFGFQVYSYFESQYMASNPYLRLPTPTEQCMGGHGVAAVGYNDDKKLIKVRNSWGPGWGDNGHFYMPYDYITDPDLASDFYTIRSLNVGN